MNETGLYVYVKKDDGNDSETIDIVDLSGKQRLEVATTWADFERERRINFINSLLLIIKEA
jgi:hypothetical protein